MEKTAICRGKKFSKSNLKQANLYLIWLEIPVCIIKTGSFQRNLMNKNYLQIRFHSTTFISETTKKLSQIYLKNPAINFISSQTPIDQVVSEKFKCKSLQMTDAKWRQYLARVDDDHAHQIMTSHTTLCVHHLNEQMKR